MNSCSDQTSGGRRQTSRLFDSHRPQVTDNKVAPEITPLRASVLALWLQLPPELLSEALEELIDIYRFAQEDAVQAPVSPPVTYRTGTITEVITSRPALIDLDH